MLTNLKLLLKVPLFTGKCITYTGNSQEQVGDFMEEWKSDWAEDNICPGKVLDMQNSAGQCPLWPAQTRCTLSRWSLPTIYSCDSVNTEISYSIRFPAQAPACISSVPSSAQLMQKDSIFKIASDFP